MFNNFVQFPLMFDNFVQFPQMLETPEFWMGILPSRTLCVSDGLKIFILLLMMFDYFVQFSQICGMLFARLKNRQTSYCYQGGGFFPYCIYPQYRVHLMVLLRSFLCKFRSVFIVPQMQCPKFVCEFQTDISNYACCVEYPLRFLIYIFSWIWIIWFEFSHGTSYYIFFSVKILFSIGVSILA